MADWGTGTYELTAAQLAPVAEVVLDAVEPVSGLKTLDLACGTGNAALLAAKRGALVTGLDAAPRLLEVAADRAKEAGADVTWTEGSMLDLPYADDSFEIVTSVFGVIFGDPPAAVASEIARVLDQHGRIAFTTWTNEGILPRIAKLSKDTVNEVFDLPPDDGPSSLNWGDETDIRERFSGHGIMLQVEKKSITFEFESAAAANDEWKNHHPMWLALKDAIGEENFEALSEKVLAILEEGNESEGGGFSYTSGYLLALGSPV